MMRKIEWYVQIDDIIGGFIVADKDLPTSAHDNRSNGNPDKHVYIIAECFSREDAETIKTLLNTADYVPNKLR